MGRVVNHHSYYLGFELKKTTDTSLNKTVVTYQISHGSMTIGSAFTLSAVRSYVRDYHSGQWNPMLPNLPERQPC